MPVIHKYIYRSIILCLLLQAVRIDALSQRRQHDAIFLLYSWPFKDGVIVLHNTYAPDKKQDNNILTDAYRPHGTYVYSVYGKRTTLFATPYTATHAIPESIEASELYSAYRKTYLNPANLLTRIRKNGKTIKDWAPAPLSTPAIDSAIYYYPKNTRFKIYVLADDNLQIDDVMVVDGKLKTDSTILFTYYIRRIARPIKPRLVAWSHEWRNKESRITPEIINQHVLGANTVVKKIETGELEGGDGAKLNNWLIAPTSTFIFFFSKADTAFADSTMEYRIQGGRYTDSNWIKTGHLIMMDGLTGNERYSLEVRYRSNPENTQVYTFVTKPWWYQRNWLKWVTGGALFLLILLLINASYRRKLAKEKAKKAGLADRLRNMQTQLNPHFIFNALGSIQALMGRQENDKAHQYLSTFGSLLRNVLNNSNHDNTTLDQEIGSLESYLQLEQLRFQFRYNITVAEDIQTTIVSLPVMLLQPLVENAIRHGIDGMEEKGQISILFIRENNNLQAVIKDNGKGFDTTRPATGYGLKLVKEKIQLINTLNEQQSIQIDIQSTNTGTAVHLTFKNWLA